MYICLACYLCLFFFFVNATTSKTVRTTRIIKHISNVMSLILTFYSYSLQPVLINQCCSDNEWIKAIITDLWYIHARSLQPFSQDYNLASYATYVVFINWRKNRFLRKFSWQFFIYFQSFCQKWAGHYSSSVRIPT